MVLGSFLETFKIYKLMALHWHLIVSVPAEGDAAGPFSFVWFSRTGNRSTKFVSVSSIRTSNLEAF